MATLSFSPTLPLGSLTLVARAVDAQGRFGAPSTVPLDQRGAAAADRHAGGEPELGHRGRPRPARGDPRRRRGLGRQHQLVSHAAAGHAGRRGGLAQRRNPRLRLERRLRDRRPAPGERGLAVAAAAGQLPGARRHRVAVRRRGRALDRRGAPATARRRHAPRARACPATRASRKGPAAASRRWRSMCRRRDRGAARRSSALAVGRARVGCSRRRAAAEPTTPPAPPRDRLHHGRARPGADRRRRSAPPSTRTTARHLPGTGGDAALAAQDLPGVARAAPGATGLVVWGAAPAESRVLFDGVEIPALTHFGGFRSTVGAELVGRIDVVPGAYGADYGRALGGLVRIEPRPLETQRHRTWCSTRTCSTAAPPGAAASDACASPPPRAPATSTRPTAASLPASTLDSTSAQSLFPIPRYSDAQVEATLPLGDARHRCARSRWRRSIACAAISPATPPGCRRAPRTSAPTGGAPRSPTRSAATTTASARRSTPAATTTSDEQQFGAAPASQSISSREVGLRARYRARLGPAWRLTLGLDGWLQSSRRAARRQPDHPGARGRSGRSSASRPATTSTPTAGRRPSATSRPTPARRSRTARWSVTPGVRADAFPVDGSRALPPIGATPVVGYAHLDGAIDPRLVGGVRDLARG